MGKVMFSLPNSLVNRMKVVIPDGERSRVLAALLEKEIAIREKNFYEQALKLESNKKLKTEMKKIEKAFSGDGLDEL